MDKLDFFSTLYSGLAKVFASPGLVRLPDWLALPGMKWPFFYDSARLASLGCSNELIEAVADLTQVAGSNLSTRQQEYEQLFVGYTNPPIWLYEAHYIDGRILGPSSFKVSTLYARYGLEVDGSELPDHASVELAFLAFLIQQESESTESTQAQVWREARTLFIKEHAMTWLPGVGKALVTSGYPGWAAIGRLLIASLSADKPAPKIINVREFAPKDLIPIIEKVDQCILCGFCVQICPTRALTIHEDRQTTSLRLSVPACIHCKKCMQVCPAHVIDMSSAFSAAEKLPEIQNQGLAIQPILLVESPRVACPKCGEPTVSKAELGYVIQHIGHPNWLDHCANCRGSIQKTDPYSTPNINHAVE